MYMALCMCGISIAERPGLCIVPNNKKALFTNKKMTAGSVKVRKPSPLSIKGQYSGCHNEGYVAGKHGILVLNTL